MRLQPAYLAPATELGFAASCPFNTVTDALGNVKVVATSAVMTERAAGPSGSAIPPFTFECH